MRTRTFAAMGTQIELLLDDDGGEADAALAGAESEFHRLEALLSRFRPESELSALNRVGEARVGAELLELADLAVAARERTGGRFDPTVHDALAAAGYDRSFDRLADAGAPAPDGDAPRCGGGITIDRPCSRIALEDGYRLDLGGIAKGWAADRALESLRHLGPALVNAGGDIAASGGCWPVGVETPSGSITIELRRGALATSGCDRRRWLRHDVVRHHLIDPRTSRPADGDILTVTVAAATAAEAEVLGTSLFLAGNGALAAAEADALGAPALIVTHEGETLLAGGLA